MSRHAPIGKRLKRAAKSLAIRISLRALIRLLSKLRPYAAVFLLFVATCIPTVVGALWLLGFSSGPVSAQQEIQAPAYAAAGTAGPDHCDIIEIRSRFDCLNNTCFFNAVAGGFGLSVFPNFAIRVSLDKQNHWSLAGNNTASLCYDPLDEQPRVYWVGLRTVMRARVVGDRTQMAFIHYEDIDGPTPVPMLAPYEAARTEYDQVSVPAWREASIAHFPITVFDGDCYGIGFSTDTPSAPSILDLRSFHITLEEIQCREQHHDSF